MSDAGRCIFRNEFCDSCGEWTQQFCRALVATQGVRYALTEWGCLSCYRVAVDGNAFFGKESLGRGRPRKVKPVVAVCKDSQGRLAV